MSEKDKLEEYERNWKRHLNWRIPKERDSSGGRSTGKYVETDRLPIQIIFEEMPAELRDRVKLRLEDTVRALVDEEHAKFLVIRKSMAIDEARQTIAELSVPEEPSA